MCLYFFSLKIQQLEQGKSDLEKAMKELGEVSVLTVEHQMKTHHQKTSGERYLQGWSVVCLGLITENKASVPETTQFVGSKSLQLNRSGFSKIWPDSKCKCFNILIQWKSSFGTPLFRDTRSGPDKMLAWSLFLLPVLKRHLYSGERGTISASRNPGITSIQGTAEHTKRHWPSVH